MAIPAVSAANAYAVQAKEMAEAAKSAAGVQSQDSGKFTALLQDTMNSVMETGKSADQQMQLQATGQGNVVDVVTAVAEAELAVQTIVSVRDRVLGAYQEIMRMPI